MLQLLVLRPAVVKTEEEAPTLKELVKDPYIIISAGKYWNADGARSKMTSGQTGNKSSI